MSNETDEAAGDDVEGDVDEDAIRELELEGRVEAIDTDEGEVEVLTKIDLVPLEDVRPYVNNPKEHPEVQVGKIASSIDEFAWDQPIVVDETGEIVKGHGRYLSAKNLGIDRVPVIVNEYESDAEKKAARIADNRTAESEWDDELLASELERIDEAGYELEETGFDDGEIDDLLDELDGGAGSGDLDFEPGSLSRDFGIPPFSILDTRQGYWRDRAEEWRNLGLDEFGDTIGRDGGLLSGRGSEGSIMTGDWQDSVGKDSAELGGNYDGTSTFDPVLADLLYSWFSPDPDVVDGDVTILDPFAGGPVRAVVAAVLGKRYVGVDINGEQVEANRSTWAEIVDPIRGSFGPTELPTELDSTPSTTPIEQHGDVWFKREDKYVRAGVNGSKVRGYFHIADEVEDVQGITGGIARVSPNLSWIAAVGKRLDVPVRLHTAHGERTRGMEIAESLGAEVVQHEPGYMNQIRKEAKADAEDRDGWVCMPLAGKSDVAHDLRVEQVESLREVEDEIERVVVPVGSGFSVGGVLEGVDRFDLDVDVLGVSVGIDPSDSLDEYAPSDWEERDDFELVESELEYEETPEQTTLEGVPLDPIYEAKAIPFVEPGDLFWVVATRETALPPDDPRYGITTGEHPDVPTKDPLVRPRWIEGDSAELPSVLEDSDVDDVDDVDLVFSCPPYHDLEKYTDDPGDLSNMSWDEFRETYREVIEHSLDVLGEDRFAAFVVSDVRDRDGAYRGLPAETVRSFVDARDDVVLYNEAVLINEAASLPARARNMFEGGRKLGRQHQNVLVFFKGDPSPQNIAEALGEIEVPESVIERVEGDE